MTNYEEVTHVDIQTYIRVQASLRAHWQQWEFLQSITRLRFNINHYQHYVAYRERNTGYELSFKYSTWAKLIRFLSFLKAFLSIISSSYTHRYRTDRNGLPFKYSIWAEMKAVSFFQAFLSLISSIYTHQYRTDRNGLPFNIAPALSW